MSVDYKNIIPECYVDTNVVTYLMHVRTVNHQYGCGNVANILLKDFANQFAIGIIDNDKIKIKYLDECEAITNSAHLRVLKHRKLPHYIIIVGTINRAMDGFLWDCAEEQSISPEEFNLPAEFGAFKNYLKKQTSQTDPDIRRLVKAISGNLELVAFQKLLLYLKDNTYQAKRDDIVRIFE